MIPREPIRSLPTHEVHNQPPPLVDYDAFASDPALREALSREGGEWATERCSRLGQRVGSEEVVAWGHDANRYPPELRTFDRYGHRIDEVEFHPTYHQLMALAMDHEIPTLAWTSERPGGHVAHTALGFLFAQAEVGVLCPVSMTYAAVPALRHQPDVAAQWLPQIFSSRYDARMIPATQKSGVTFGMAMTEKQGGSDVRANTTRARPYDGHGPGATYLLTGHKWFCSAPMCDAFLTLAHSERGLSCFLVPRFRPDGTRNNFFIQRLKDKLGNRSNASSEIEYCDTWAVMVGEEGRGVRTIIDMVHHTRLDAAFAPAAMMRQALVQAVHHCSHRAAFGEVLVEQPLMRNVLADLALEVEAGTMLVMRVARAFDESPHDATAASFARIGTAIAKYWLNKRAPGHVVEALECHGGAGYVEESMMPRLYREAPLNGIWEGSGNVICLDILRAMSREPGCIESLRAEIEPAAASYRPIAEALETVQREIGAGGDIELRARRIAERMAKLLCASLLVRHAKTPIADAYVRSRLLGESDDAYGTLPVDVDFGLLIDRARPLPGA